jgi:riboflavin synthase
MFTGIVQAVGRIVGAKRRSEGLRIDVSTGSLDIGDVHVGDSVAVKGCCLTVVEVQGSMLGFDVSAETLRCTAGLDHPHEVNLEKALRLGDQVGGHLLTGHVDGVGTVLFATSGADGGGLDLEIEVPTELARFVAAKGSIAVDGVSLTVNTVSGRRFAVHLIPHTLAATTLAGLSSGDRINVEIDIVARYLERMTSYRP